MNDWDSRCERLIGVVVEFARRLRAGDDPDDVLAWLLESTDEWDRWALPWVQAAAGQTTVVSFVRRAAWCGIDRPAVDEIAVQRRMRGDTSVRLNVEEKRHAVRVWHGRMSAPQLAAALGVTRRTICRWLADDNPQPVDGAA